MAGHANSSDAERISAEEAAAVFAALSQETRLEAFRLLLRYQPFGLKQGDIARLLAVPHNTLSTHLSILQNADLVRSRRDGRVIVFAAVPARFAAVQGFLIHGLCDAGMTKPAKAAEPVYLIPKPSDGAADRVDNVLILCTANSVRSILAEAMIIREGGGRFRVYSAGSQPKRRPDPLALEILTGLGYETHECRSKSWIEFAGKEAPKMDFIITVCDKAAGEACPHWPGHPLVVHWGIPDPLAVKGTPEQRRAAIREAYRQLMSRVTTFVNLPFDELSLPELKSRLSEIGRMDGATEMAMTGKAA